MKLRKWFSGAILMAVMCLGLAGTAMADEQEQTVVYAGTVEELEEALKSNVKIVLEGKDYTYKGELYLQDLENVTIQGTEGTRIMSNSSVDYVFMVVNCKNIVLEDIVLGHDIPTHEPCDAGVINGYNSEMTISGCDIFGCGLVGMFVDKCQITMQNSIIRDCSGCIMEIFDSITTFEECTFSGNGYDGRYRAASGVYISAFQANSVCNFSNCVFENNKNPKFISVMEEEANTGYTCDNCEFSGNVWDNDNILVESIMVFPEELTLKVGESFQLSMDIFPKDATDLSVWWAAYGDAVSVDAQGLVTAVKEGGASIHCKSLDGSGTYSNFCEIHVEGTGTDRGTWTQAEDGSWKFTDSAGNPCINTWVAVENQYANEAEGQQKFDWFRFDENGRMLTGWYYDSEAGHWYYLNPVSDGILGKMMTGWVIIDGAYYYFNPNSDGGRGRLYMNETTPDGYQVDGDGKWIM